MVFKNEYICYNNSLKKAKWKGLVSVDERNTEPSLASLSTIAKTHAA
jgi:hypothetical protein